MTRANGQRGSLLIDAMIAMSFFGVVLGGWLTLTNAKTRAISEAEHRFRAVHAAESALAEYREGARGAGAFTAAGGYEGVIATSERKDGLREVTVTVRWIEPGRREEKVEIVTAVGGGS